MVNVRGSLIPLIRLYRLWDLESAATDPYTLAIVLHEALDTPMQWDARILATDISTRMLRIAREGLYEESRVAAVPPQQRLTYFVREKTPHAVLWRIRPEIRSLVTFRRLNLMNETYPFSGKFDIIFRP
jgi:chemotaxis protein methyltransferase CheR